MIYTVNDTTSYATSVCTGALCPPGAVPYVQNTQNNAYAPAGATFATCAGGALGGCASAVATPFADVSNDPDHMRCAQRCLHATLCAPAPGMLRCGGCADSMTPCLARAASWPWAATFTASCSLSRRCPL